MTDQIDLSLQLKDGRNLGYAQFGSPDGGHFSTIDNYIGEIFEFLSLI